MSDILEELRSQTDEKILHMVDFVWQNAFDFLKWPDVDRLFMPGTARTRYHVYSTEQSAELRSRGIPRDRRSNGPAIAAFRLAGGVRPQREASGRAWSVHHIYDGQFPAPGRNTSLHAVRDPNSFTRTAGLVAAHPIADALADEVPYFAWMLRYKAFQKFSYDPDNVFATLKMGESL